MFHILLLPTINQYRRKGRSQSLKSRIQALDIAMNCRVMSTQWKSAWLIRKATILLSLLCFNVCRKRASELPPQSFYVMLTLDHVPIYPNTLRQKVYREMKLGKQTQCPLMPRWWSCLVQFSQSAVSDSLQPHGCSTPGFPVHHQLPELTQTHVHEADDAIQPSHPLSSPSPLILNLSQHQGLF